MSTFFRIVGNLMILVVFIGGIIAGDTFKIGHFNVLIMIGVWIGGSIPALIMLGMSGILDKLDILNKKFEDMLPTKDLNKEES